MTNLSFSDRCKILSMPIPKEAIETIEGQKGFSSIADAYLSHLLNIAFGIGNWTFREIEQTRTDYVCTHRQGNDPDEWTMTDEFILTVKGELYFYEYERTIGPVSISKDSAEVGRGKYNGKRVLKTEDISKACITAVIKKILKTMGVGKEVYMGFYDNASQSYQQAMPYPMDADRLLQKLNAVKNYGELEKLQQHLAFFQHDPVWKAAVKMKEQLLSSSVEQKIEKKVSNMKPSTRKRAIDLVNSAIGNEESLKEALVICKTWVEAGDKEFLDAVKLAQEKTGSKESFFNKQ